MKKCSSKIIISLVPLILILIYLAGPSIEMDTDFDTPEIPENIENYIFDNESNYKDLRPGTEKKIFWAGGKAEKTQYSIVYLHGFTASRIETEPVTSVTANALKANAFFTRLKGHGHYQLSSQSNIKLSDWLYDAYEAVQIGKKLGDKIIIISCSSGAALASWICDKYPEKIAAVIMISPNFKLYDSRFSLLSFRWGPVIAKIAEGKIIGENETVISPEHAAGWSYIYKTEMLFPLAALLETVKIINFENIHIPLKIFYSPDDQIVDHEKTYFVFERWGSINKKIIEVENPGDRNNHIIAGDVFSPATNDFVSSEIVSFIQNLK